LTGVNVLLYPPFEERGKNRAKQNNPKSNIRNSK
jgi:hypothetical protein